MALGLSAAGCTDFRSANPSPPAPTTDAGNVDADAHVEPVIGKLTGGPCASGEKGATAFRVLWEDGKTRAVPKIEELGLPDSDRFSIIARELDGSEPQFGDPFLGAGGVEVGSSAYIDIEMSTRGLAQLQTATLSILGRSYDTSESGSFSWQTSQGTGKLAPATISNGAPYEWASANVTQELPLEEAKVQLRIRPGPPSMSLVVHRIELCVRL